MRESIPFVVLVPLMRRSLLPADTPTVGRRLNPAFQAQGIDVVLPPLDRVSVPLNQLGARVGSLADEGHSMANALDALLTRSWG